jgi:hypothetical protein
MVALEVNGDLEHFDVVAHSQDNRYFEFGNDKNCFNFNLLFNIVANCGICVCRFNLPFPHFFDTNASCY